MFKLFSGNRVGALIILFICINSTSLLSRNHSAFLLFNNLNHPFFRMLESVNGSLEEPESWIPIFRKTFEISTSKLPHLNSSSSTGKIFSTQNKVGKKNQIYSKNSLYWVLFVNYFVVFFASFIILYRTRVKQGKISTFKRDTYLE